jgi:hypothetical protein
MELARKRPSQLKMCYVSLFEATPSQLNISDVRKFQATPSQVNMLDVQQFVAKRNAISPSVVRICRLREFPKTRDLSELLV